MEMNTFDFLLKVVFGLIWVIFNLLFTCVEVVTRLRLILLLLAFFRIMVHPQGLPLPATSQSCVTNHQYCRNTKEDK